MKTTNKKWCSFTKLAILDFCNEALMHVNNPDQRAEDFFEDWFNRRYNRSPEDFRFDVTEDQISNVMDFYADLGVPDGIIPGDKVIVTLSASEYGYPFGEDKKNFGTFIGVSKNLKGETLFMIAPSNGVMSYGDKIQRPPDRKKNDKLDYISNCPFHHCALNSGNGTCHSTNTKQCDSVPSQFLER